MNIAINTGGGDAPGLNAAIRAATLAALRRSWNVYGIKNGYGSIYTDEPFTPLTEETVRGITMRGGTILGTASKGNPFEMPYEKEDGTIGTRDVSDHLVEQFEAYDIDALVAIGGDGSMAIANKLIQKGIKVIGVPKTIDNDIWGCDITLGFDTARSIATESIDRITTTAESHRRLMVVEVMGRYAGWIALYSGLASTADVILIPEIPFQYDSIIGKIEQRKQKEKNYTIIVAAEGAKPEGGHLVTKEEEPGYQERLGGIGGQVAHQLTERTGQESRSVVLGHLQRGGSPTTFDRLISLRFGAAAIRCLEAGTFNKLVVLRDNHLTTIPIDDVAGKMKAVPMDNDTLHAARDVGICMGD